MRRRVPSALLLLLCLCAAAPAAPKKGVPLEVVGDTVVVVRAFPFKVVAQPGADVYLWSVPDTVKATADDNVLTVTAAPKGTFTARVADADLDRAGLLGHLLRLEVDRHRDDAPPGPGPEPQPEDELTRAVRAAYAEEAGGDRAALCKALAAVYDAGGQLVREKKPATMGQVWKAMDAGALAAGVKGKLPKVQAALKARVWDRLPARSGDKLDGTLHARIAESYEAAAKALREVAR